MFFKDRLLGLRKIALRSSCWEATIDRDFVSDFLHRSCIISCMEPHYFRSTFCSMFLHSGFHSCPHKAGYTDKYPPVTLETRVKHTIIFQNSIAPKHSNILGSTWHPLFSHASLPRFYWTTWKIRKSTPLH